MRIFSLRHRAVMLRRLVVAGTGAQRSSWVSAFLRLPWASGSTESAATANANSPKATTSPGSTTPPKSDSFPNGGSSATFGERRLPWAQAVTQAERLVHAGGGTLLDPRELLGRDLSLLTDNIRRLLGSGHPVLTTISGYYFGRSGKHVRPLLVLLVAQATGSVGVRNSTTSGGDGATSNSNTSGSMPLSDAMVDAPLTAHPSAVAFASPAAGDDASLPPPLAILPAQRRLAEITEMIHTASLLHDDVIDAAETRRGLPSANAHFGNKMAILAGDFLLARASVALARLRNLEVVELFSTIISNLVEGEFMQMRNSAIAGYSPSPAVNTDTTTTSNTNDLDTPHATLPVTSASSWLPTSITNQSASASLPDRFEYYMRKTYMKTASLIAISCRATSILGGCPREINDLAYSYGRSVGLAFQLVDDMLDFVVSAEDLGKPSNADLQLGLATAPVLFAAETFPELYPLIERGFKNAGDVERARELVFKTDGIQRTLDLAAAYCRDAVDAVSNLPPSRARTALIQLTEAILTRKK